MVLMVWILQSNTIVSPYLVFIVPQPDLGSIHKYMWSACSYVQAYIMGRS